MKPPRVLSIAGSDSGGGAGIQADIKTITMLGGYAMTAVTALTAQNTTGVSMVEAASPAMVAAQIDACVGDLGVDAVKIGMLGSPAIAAVVAERLERLAVPVVFDPVMIATSGASLADEATIAAFKRLMRLATVVTPNTQELEVLAGMAITNEIEQSLAAQLVMESIPCPAVLAKGGHLILSGETYGKTADGVPYRFDNATRVFDFLFKCCADGVREIVWDSERIATRHTHGTGCTLSSAIATHLGRGLVLADAVAEARQFVRAALLAAPGFGAGHGPLGHHAVR